MTDYKLVPLEPTPAMVEAAEQQPDVTQLAEALERQNKLPVERGES